jgi:hypothetical protein
MIRLSGVETLFHGLHRPLKHIQIWIHLLDGRVRYFHGCIKSQLWDPDFIGFFKITCMTENLDVCFGIATSFGDRDDMVEM